MDEEIERLVIGVRADTAGFARDVGAMRAALADGLGAGGAQAAGAIEAALGRATKAGKLGFDDLARVALKAIGQIAGAATGAPVRGGGGLAGVASSLLGAALGLPGRATGGPVAPGASYLVGERGPELFVPTASGAVRPMAAASGAREVKVSIAVNAAAGEGSQALARSGRQVARAVAQALARAEE